MSYSQAYQAALAQEMERDDSIIVLGTDLFIRGGHWAQVKGLGPRFGHARVRDTPISEAAIIAAGVGGALNGLRPVVDLNFLDFAFGAMDEIVNQAAKARYMWGVPVPLLIRATWGVAFGAAQHNNEIEAWFVHTPGLVVLAPSTPADVAGYVKYSLRSSDPVLFLMHKNLTGVKGDVPDGDVVLEPGKASIVEAGSDVTLVTYGGYVPRMQKVVRSLAQQGTSVELLDLRSLYPLDMDSVLRSVSKTGRLVVVSDAPTPASIGSWVCAEVAERSFAYLKAPVMNVGASHAPIAHSPALFNAQIPDDEEVAHAVLASVAWSPGGAR